MQSITDSTDANDVADAGNDGIGWITSAIPLLLEKYSLLSLLIVSLIWGVTNAFMTLTTKSLPQSDKISNSNSSKGTLMQFLYSVYQIVTHISFLSIYGLNQCGSVLYYATLPHVPLNVAVPFTNTLTMVWTVVTSILLGETRIVLRDMIGCVFIVVGATICALHS